MVDGTYAVVVRTPVGAKKATVMLSSEDEGTVCSAIVEARGKRVVSQGTLEGDSFQFSGEADTPLGHRTFEVAGTADGQTLEASITSHGKLLKAKGKRA